MERYAIPALQARWSLGDGRVVEVCRVEGRLRYLVRGPDRHYAGLLWQDEAVFGVEGPLLGMPADQAARLLQLVASGAPPVLEPPPPGLAVGHREGEVVIAVQPGVQDLALGRGWLRLGSTRHERLEGVLGCHVAQGSVWILTRGAPWKISGLHPDRAAWIRRAVDEAVIEARTLPMPAAADRTEVPVPRGVRATRDLGTLEVDLGPDMRAMGGWMAVSLLLAVLTLGVIATAAALGASLLVMVALVVFMLTPIPALHGLWLRRHLRLEGRRLVLWREGLWRGPTRVVLLEDVRRVEDSARQVEVEVGDETLVLVPRRDRATREWLVAQLEEAVGERLEAVERQSLTAVDGPPEELTDLVRRP